MIGGRTPRRIGESLLPGERLRRRSDFLRCYERGERRHGTLATVYVVERGGDPSHPRLGITVTRKVGGAVARHRIKRRIREIYRRWSKRSQLPPCDILVHVKPAARRADFRALRTELLRQLGPLTRCTGRAG